MRAALLALPVLMACGGAALPQGTTAEACGVCHQEQYEGWSATHHARSATSPVFEALLPRVEAAWGAPARARCVACHAPGFGGEMAPGCVTCHGAVGNRGAKDGALVVSLDAPLAGTKAVSTAAHQVEPRAFLRDSTLCATCHEVTGPGLLDEPTYTEFTATRFATDNDCVGCHVEADDPSGQHRLVGVDPLWGAAPAVAAQATRASAALWRKALALEVLVEGETFAVQLRNTGAGHAVPTGAAHLREVWVEVEVVDARGVRFPLPRLLELGARLTRGGVEVPLVTDADTVTSRGLAEHEARAVAVPVPAGAQRPVRVFASLWARAVRAEALTALGLEARAGEVPALRVATAEGE